MTEKSSEPVISERATRIVRGLIVSKRAVGVITTEGGHLRLKCRAGGYYWIGLDGWEVRRGETLTKADQLQPKFFDAMERAGH